ncbi:3-oxoacyl-ACP synthase [candidate division KSB1 bacterium RBG_16_48_16]|nr:MAG: 3-oxoacyl-ACP synthase [candidate division KSB1 bacterium RBG_16_48_16]
MIVGTGVGIPNKILTNHDLEQIVDTTDEWIRTRTGIETRHIVEDGQATSDLCVEAAKNALDDAGLLVEQVDVIIVATISGDVGFPSAACFVQKKLGAVNAYAFDIAAACSGFIYGLDVADSIIAMQKAKTVLVIGGETLSRITDYTDRATCVLFGDGAGAAVLQPSDGNRGILATLLKSDGRLDHLLYMQGLGTKCPPSHQSVDAGAHFIRMAGKEVFKYAVTAMGEAAEQILKLANITVEEVDLLITHQANYRIIDATARRIEVPSEKVFINVNKYGNTSSASIPIALDEARKSGLLKEGQIAVFVAFGAGFTWGAAALRM